MTDPRTSQFAFNICSIDPSTAGRLPWIANTESDAVYEKLYRLFANTSFLEKTKFRQLHLIFWVVPDHYIENEISFENNKRGLLTVKKNIHSTTACREVAENGAQFLLSHGTSMLQAVCERLGLASFESSQTSGMHCAHDGEDELQLHIKLNDAEMGDMDQFLANTNLIEAADQTLRAANVGRFDACEIGMGFETMFFLGPDAQRMLDVLEPIISGLPNGSYAEIIRPAGSKRVEL